MPALGMPLKAPASSCPSHLLLPLTLEMYEVAVVCPRGRPGVHASAANASRITPTASWSARAAVALPDCGGGGGGGRRCGCCACPATDTDSLAFALVPPLQLLAQVPARAERRLDVSVGALVWDEHLVLLGEVPAATPQPQIAVPFQIPRWVCFHAYTSLLSSFDCHRAREPLSAHKTPISV